MASTRERIGQPTQFHGVPVEDRAVDLQGHRLPWALEWADDHPNARSQKRQPEDKGSFGKSLRRRGSSRNTRTQTPAKKENPALDGFEAALKFDSLNPPSRQTLASTHGLADSIHHNVPPLSKEPMQVMLYGFSPSTQWAAIHHYEVVSGGIIYEEYEREAPAELRRFQDVLGQSAHCHHRPLTKTERALAMQYKGGRCWIKVTFDSIEAAERAIHSSPHLIQGHWVYAQPYRGQEREPDEPILIREEDRQQGLLGAPRPAVKPFQTLGPSSSASALQHKEHDPRLNATLPRGFTMTDSGLDKFGQADEPDALSSSTASSATALEPNYPDLRHRLTSEPIANQMTTTGIRTVSRPSTFTHFPNTPRTVLRPAAEAFLPQPTWADKFFKQLTQHGLIPGDVIGVAVPRLENGEFDWASASFYWKVCRWLDINFGLDLCGMKEA